MSAPESSIQIARKVLEAEATAVRDLVERIGAAFELAVELLLERKGSIIVTGLGKSGLIGTKTAATLSSIGAAAHFVHAAEAQHGDAGRLRPGDVLIAFSNSGTTSEVCAFAQLAVERGCPVIVVTGRPESSLAQLASAVLDVSVTKEADPLNLAPTNSTTAALAMGDALAIAVMTRLGITSTDFQRNHAGGALGRGQRIR